MEEIERTRRKIQKEFERNIEMDDSDIPVHEKFVKEENIKKLKKGYKE